MRRGLGHMNIPLLVISMLLAVTLWIVVEAQTMQFSKKEATVPLTVANLDPRYVVVSVPLTIPVTFQGPEDKLDATSLKSAQAVVNLRDATPGIHTYEAFVIARDPDVKQLLPRDTAPVTVDVEEKITRSFKVVVDTHGSIADRTVIFGGAQCDPAYVDYSGSENALASIAKVRASLNLDEVSPDQPDSPIKCNIDALDSSGHAVTKVTPNVAQVDVRPTINPATVSKELFVIPTFVGQPAQGFEITGYEALPGRLSITGRSMRLAALSSVPTAPIDVTGLDHTVTLRARVNLPEGLRGLNSNPIQVHIEIRREPVSPAPPPASKPKDTPFPDHVPPLSPTKGGSH